MSFKDLVGFLFITVLTSAIGLWCIFKINTDWFNDGGIAEAGIMDRVTEHEMKHAYCYTVGIAHEKLVCIPKEMK